MNNMIDEKEIKKFDALAYHWWDTKGALKTLHHINPTRLSFINSQMNNAPPPKNILDVGCGGGILTESLAQQNPQVMGIDASQKAIFVAKNHAKQQGFNNIEYRACTAEVLAQEKPQSFELITCMELLEHVPSPPTLINACAKLVKPGGKIIFSTLNRTPKAFLLGIVAAEYWLNILPKGTHHYAKFIRPSELDAWARQAQLKLQALKGLYYNPFNETSQLSDDISINYLAAYT